MKKIMSILGIVGIVAAAAAAGSATHAWAKDHFQGDILESVAATFNITDSILAQKASSDKRKIILDEMDRALRDTESLEVKERLKDLKRQWELDRKRLNNAINTKVHMIATMAKRRNVSML